MGHSMRVAYLINQYPKVSHSFIRREIHALEAQGWTIERFAIRGWDEPLADPEDAVERDRTDYLLGGGVAALLGVTLRCAVARPLAWLRALRATLQMAAGHSDRSLVRHLASLAQACVLWHRVSKSRAVHLHAHFGTNSAEVALLTHLLGGIPFSFTVHGPEEFDRPQSLHLGFKMRHASFVVAVSSFGRSQLYRWLPGDEWHKARVVHCGLDQGFLRAPQTTVPYAPRLVCVGRLCEQKGQLLLLEAVRLLVQRSRPVELVLAGDGELRAEIEQYVRQHDLHTTVRITGWIGAAQVQAELMAARALVLPSFAEGLPVVIMEAMALGRPVLSTFVAGIPELVVHGSTGWLFPAGDIEALVDAMEAVLRAMPEDLQTMGERGRQRVLNRHDIQQEAGKLARCITAASAT